VKQIVDETIVSSGIRLLGARKSAAKEEEEIEKEIARIGPEGKNTPLVYRLLDLETGEPQELLREHLDWCSIFVPADTPLTGIHWPGEEDEADAELVCLPADERLRS